MTKDADIRKLAQDVLDKGGYATTSTDACTLARYVLGHLGRVGADMDAVAEALWKADTLDGERREPWADVSEDWKESKWRKLARAVVGTPAATVDTEIAETWPEPWRQAVATACDYVWLPNADKVLDALRNVGALRTPGIEQK